MSTTPPITDPQQFTATDPRVAQVLALIRAKTGQAPVADPTAPPLTTMVQPPTLADTAASNAVATSNLQPPPTNLPQMLSAPPQLPPPTAPQTTSQPGPVKSFLQQLVSGLGGAAYQGTQGALQRLGIPTDYEKQQNALKIGLQQQAQNTNENYRKSLADLATGKASQLDQLTAPYAIDKNDQSVLPQFRGTTTNFAGYQALQKLSGQNQGKAEVATINQQGGAVPVSAEFANRIGHPELSGVALPAKAIASFSKQLSGASTGIDVRDVGDKSVVFDRTQASSPNHGIIQVLGPATRLLQAGIYANNRSVQVVDPNNPDRTIMMSPAQANNLGAQGTQSIGFQTTKALQKYFTSGAGAANLTSFNTAISHLGTLQQLTGALNNGDTQLVNRLGNEFARQTGSAAPTSFDAAKIAVSGEIAKVFKGTATEGEIAAVTKEINDAESPQQLYGVINTNVGLLQSKRNYLQQQYEQGKQGKPNFGAGAASPATSAPGGWAAKFGGVPVK